VSSADYGSIALPVGLAGISRCGAVKGLAKASGLLDSLRSTPFPDIFCFMIEAVSTVRTWYSVRTVYLHTGTGTNLYEERITVWQASSLSEAIELAEVEARKYAGEVQSNDAVAGTTYLGLAQGYFTFIEGASIGPADEIFSLIRASKLGPKAYLDAFFNTGLEQQTTTEVELS
jgi:hypothetical protein